jgi:hypothetical protein
MLSAALETVYVLALGPKSRPMLASPLVVFTITFLCDFATSGASTAASTAGPATFVVMMRVTSANVVENAAPSPAVCAPRVHRQRWVVKGEGGGRTAAALLTR